MENEKQGDGNQTINLLHSLAIMASFFRSEMPQWSNVLDTPKLTCYLYLIVFRINMLCDTIACFNRIAIVERLNNANYSPNEKKNKLVQHYKFVAVYDMWTLA